MNCKKGKWLQKKKTTNIRNERQSKKGTNQATKKKRSRQLVQMCWKQQKWLLIHLLHPTANLRPENCIKNLFFDKTDCQNFNWINNRVWEAFEAFVFFLFVFFCFLFHFIGRLCFCYFSPNPVGHSQTTNITFFFSKQV